MEKLFLYGFSALILLTVLLPAIKKDSWVFRIFDYPRIQKFTLIGIALTLWILLYGNSKLWYDIVLMGSLAVSFAYLGYLIIPYTPIGRKMIHKAVLGESAKKLNVLVSNVYQYSTKYSNLLDLIKHRNPDIVFLLETDQKWLDAVKSLREEYPNYIEIPKDNTYGLLFYSKLPLSKKEVNFLIDEEIPSIVADVEFDNKSIRIYGLHPTPPVPQESEFSTDRDAEILLVGKRAKKHQGPCMVIGDLNDVAWSYTTNLFLKTSGLLDPRRGRGTYNTFNARYPLLRWPLDHFFVSDDFHLVDMRVEKDIGSDHFPISICLVLSDMDDARNFEADQDDKELAEEKIAAGINDEPR
ncbi:MAG TPA: endonuclease/exonuclease/phosphatase family protein [Flavobacterium sp.]|jgi:endonuclease/exonuclease/phosphatase (EEP) superfamily protein YafD